MKAGRSSVQQRWINGQMEYPPERVKADNLSDAGGVPQGQGGTFTPAPYTPGDGAHDEAGWQAGKTDTVIVSRHPAVVEWLYSKEYIGRPEDHIIISGNATPEDVAGKVVVGNVPLFLAAHARYVMAIEFSGSPPRGQEYGVAEMEAAGARLAKYKVQACPEPW